MEYVVTFTVMGVVVVERYSNIEETKRRVDSLRASGYRPTYTVVSH